MRMLKLWVLIAAASFLSAFAMSHSIGGSQFGSGLIHVLDTGGGGPTNGGGP